MNYGLWPKGMKNMYTKWVTCPEPITLPSKPCNGRNFIKGMEKNPCCYAYFLFIKISPVTPVSNKILGSSNNSLNLTVHRMTRCLFEISTEFAGVKIKTKINKRDGFCKRLDAIFFCCCCCGTGGILITKGAVADNVTIKTGVTKLTR